MRIKLLVFLGLSLFFSTCLLANKNKVVGVWLTQDKDSKVEILQGEDGKYYGKVVWLKNPTENGKPQVDDEIRTKN